MCMSVIYNYENIYIYRYNYIFFADTMLQLNMAMFEQTARCGYVLKPRAMWDRSHPQYGKFNPYDKETFGPTHTLTVLVRLQCFSSTSDQCRVFSGCFFVMLVLYFIMSQIRMQIWHSQLGGVDMPVSSVRSWQFVLRPCRGNLVDIVWGKSS